MRGYTPCNHIQLEICLNLAKMKKDKFSLIYGTYLGQDFTHMWDTKTNKQNKMNKPKKKKKKERKKENKNTHREATRGEGAERMAK